MKRTPLVFIAAILLAGMTGMFWGCSEEAPPQVYDPNPPAGAEPTITAVNPPTSALAGITDVVITGANFSAVPAQNTVYFDTARGTVISATATQIVVKAPNYPHPSLQIKVVVQTALTFATYPPAGTPGYALELAAEEYGGFGNLDEVYSIAMDNQENLYAQVKGSPLGLVKIVAPSDTAKPYGTMTFPKASEMRFGPAGALSLQQSNQTNHHLIPAGGGGSTVRVTLPFRASTFDFDESGNAFCGGNRTGIAVISPTGTARAVGTFATYEIRALRVYAGSLYIAGYYSGTDPSLARSGVYRCQITPVTGDLGAPATMLDWTQTGAFSASQILSLNFTADGTMLVGTDNADPILLVTPGGAQSVLYPGVLAPPATHMVWGGGSYLYVNRYSSTPSVRRVIRVTMGMTGAPEYGRN
jgi:hypothetical protein